MGLVGEEGFHFGGAFEVELVAGVAVAAGVGDEVVALEAGENIVGFGVFLVDVVDIVGGDEGEAGFFGQLDEVSIGGFLVVFAVFGEFEVEVVGAENVGVFEGEGFGFFEVTMQAGFVDFAAEVPGEADESFGVLAEHLFVDAGFVPHALEVGVGDEFDEVGVAGLVFGEEDEAEVVALGGMVVDAVAGDVEVAADDGFDAGGFGGAVEFDGAVEDGVVGHGHVGHAHVAGGSKGVFYFEGAVEEAVAGVEMKMAEGGGGHGFSSWGLDRLDASLFS